MVTKKKKATTKKAPTKSLKDVAKVTKVKKTDVKK